MKLFQRANFLVPYSEYLSKWSTVACDQFTSEPEYWEDVEKEILDQPSAYNLIFPEVYLNTIDRQNKILNINKNMEKYIDSNIFKEYANSYIYVERILLNGKVRRGILGIIDLEEYSFNDKSNAKIRATEKTVIERIPIRVEIRQDAKLELSHAILLCDDKDNELIESITSIKKNLEKIYDFDLMKSGGNIKGWLVNKTYADKFDIEFEKYCDKALLNGNTVLVVGDGNHSLAAAKTCYENLKLKYPKEVVYNHPSRYAVVELENIHDDSQVFEPIHRVVLNVDNKNLINDLKKNITTFEGHEITIVDGNSSEKVFLKNDGRIAVDILQEYLDNYLKSNCGDIDYIHEEETLFKICKENNGVGFVVPTIKTSDLFSSINLGKSLPRKTFSMGHASEKRYYLETRIIK